MKKNLHLNKETVQQLDREFMGQAYGGSRWCITGCSECEDYDTLGAYCTWETIEEPEDTEDCPDEPDSWWCDEEVTDW